jgi:hypothetical protein
MVLQSNGHGVTEQRSWCVYVSHEFCSPSNLIISEHLHDPFDTLRTFMPKICSAPN